MGVREVSLRYCDVAGDEVTTLLAALEQHVLLADARAGMLTERADVLHRRTQGCIGSLTNLLDRVCYLAIATGIETITGELIETVNIDNAAQILSSAV